MYLKSIEVHGFKSFANKTAFHFHNGVTAIVGPNGSGKSNVADAVRWVLGEQRVKQLRGGSMQDVIFAGTQARKPLGYAAVSITLDNADHMLPVSYDEITVTRRLYRSGESEYLLNGTQCRLKDINELFYDTGIGKEGYSIIGQGQIEKILSGKPEERRELFDEAVGIVKFKRRKAEAQKKLDNEQQNLSRVNDILTELSRQLGPLQRQSEKARIYLNKKEQLKAYDVNEFLFAFQELKAKAIQTQKTLDDAKEQLENTRSQSQKIRQRYDETLSGLEEISKSQEEKQDAVAQALIALQQSRSRIELLQEQIRSAKASDQQKRERLQTVESEISERETRLNELTQSLADMEQYTEDKRRESAEADETLAKLSGELDELGRQDEQCQALLMKLLNDRAKCLSEHESFQTLLEQLEIRKSERAGQILRLSSDLTDQENAADQVAAEGKEIRETIEALNGKSVEAGNELEELRRDIAEKSQQLDTRQQEYHRTASRLETLRNIAERYDGYGSSIRKVMEQRASHPGILGVVADLFKTEKKYETAIETALGGSIQNVVTEDEETAKRMISYLKQNRLGRATFLPLTAMKHAAPFKEKHALDELGVVALASELVRCDDRFDSLNQYLLGRTVVTDTIDSAIALARKYRYSLRIVTLEGDLMSPGGSMSGGAYRNSSNLLGRRREIEDLKNAELAAREALDELRSEINLLRDRQSELRGRVKQLSDELQRNYLRQNTNRMQQRELEENRGRNSRSHEELTHELKEIEAKGSETLARQQETAAALEKVDQQKAEAEEKQAALSTQQDALRTQVEELRRRVDELHVESASFQEKRSYMGSEKIRFSHEIEALEREKQLLLSGQDLLQTVHEREEEIAALEEEISAREIRVKEYRSKIEELNLRKEDLTQKQKNFFAESEALSQQESLLDRECFRLESQIEKLQETRENRISYMWEEYELTYNSALALRREDLGSPSEWKKQMQALRKQIRDLGNVNVNAIDEYKEVSERHEFLSTQQQDILKAQDALEKIIHQLDEGMRKQFREQFSRIQEEFDKAFKELFGGGQGTLELMEDEDVLEAGIRIIAQPPGKKLQNMMQLSGGEKSLTAIALLFAIQNLKPSPFCLLDEIEAALDENNVDRYAGYLHKLTKHTQFIIITHRRGTMAAADRMYGITMQEKGVSALVSVNLIEGQLDN